jgi:hypothetical protein
MDEASVRKDRWPHLAQSSDPEEDQAEIFRESYEAWGGSNVDPGGSSPLPDTVAHGFAALKFEDVLLHDGEPAAWARSQARQFGTRPGEIGAIATTKLGLADR